MGNHGSRSITRLSLSGTIERSSMFGWKERNEERVALVRGPGIALRALYVPRMIPYKVAGTAADAGGVVMF